MTISFGALAQLVGGAPLRVTTSVGEVDLQVTEATAVPAPAVGGSLIFSGPTSPELAQGAYPVQGPAIDDLLFLVPIGAGPDGRTYQAIFA